MFATTNRLLLAVAPICFAALAGVADGAITHCEVTKTVWTQIESGHYCQATGGDWCDSGWKWASYSPGWMFSCSRDGCTREICDVCLSGSYKSGFSNGFATSCTKNDDGDDYDYDYDYDYDDLVTHFPRLHQQTMPVRMMMDVKSGEFCKFAIGVCHDRSGNYEGVCISRPVTPVICSRVFDPV